MKVAVFGASGMLGSMLVDYLSPRFEVTPLTRREFDILGRHKDHELQDIVQAHDWVINAAGVIPQRSRDRGLLVKVNAVFPFELAKYRTPVIQIATDCVYSGQAGEYTEADFKDAVDDYGLSKANGEIVGAHFYNLRCSIVGLEPHGNYSLLGWLLSQPCGAVIPGYTNYLWNGITTLHFAKICEAIMRHDLQYLPNVQHIVPADYVSKCQLLRMAASAFGRTDIAVKGEAKGEGIVDRRIATERPDLNRKLWGLAGYRNPPHINEMLRELAQYKLEVTSRRS